MTDDARRVLFFVRHRKGVTVEALARWIGQPLEATWPLVEELWSLHLVTFSGRYIVEDYMEAP